MFKYVPASLIIKAWHVIYQGCRNIFERYENRSLTASTMTASAMTALAMTASAMTVSAMTVSALAIFYIDKKDQ